MGASESERGMKNKIDKSPKTKIDITTKTILCWIIKTLSHCCGRSDPRKKEQIPCCAMARTFVYFSEHVLANAMKRLISFNLNMTDLQRKKRMCLCNFFTVFTLSSVHGLTFFCLNSFCVRLIRNWL